MLPYFMQFQNCYSKCITIINLSLLYTFLQIATFREAALCLMRMKLQKNK
jgi:hypothetical protein